MAAYQTGAFVRSKNYTPFYKTPLKWIPLSKSGASKSRPRWAAHTRIGNVWEYPPRDTDELGNVSSAEFKILSKDLAEVLTKIFDGGGLESIRTSNRTSQRHTDGRK